MGTDEAFRAFLETLNRPRRDVYSRIIAGEARHGDYVRLFLLSAMPYNIVPRPPLEEPPEFRLPPPEEPQDDEPERPSMWQLG